MFNKILSYLFLFISLVCLYINYLLAASSSPASTFFFTFVVVASVLLSGFFFLNGLKKSPRNNKASKASAFLKFKTWTTWMDLVPVSAVAVALVSIIFESFAYTTKELYDFIRPSYVIFLVALVVAAIFCVLISANGQKPTFWRVLHTVGVVLLLLLIPFFGIMSIFVFGCNPGESC